MVQRRLQDLLAGWSHYVYKCAESEDPHPGVSKEEYEREGDAISDLYQQAGMGFVPTGDPTADAAIADDLLDQFLSQIKQILKNGA